MALGDVKSAITRLGSGQTLDIQPPGTEEWVVTNIYYPDSISIEFWNGIDKRIPFDQRTGKGALSKFNFHLRSDNRLLVINDSLASQNIGYDGVQSK